MHWLIINVYKNNGFCSTFIRLDRKLFRICLEIILLHEIMFTPTKFPKFLIYIENLFIDNILLTVAPRQLKKYVPNVYFNVLSAT